MRKKSPLTRRSSRHDLARLSDSNLVIGYWSRYLVSVFFVLIYVFLAINFISISCFGLACMILPATLTFVVGVILG